MRRVGRRLLDGPGVIKQPPEPCNWSARLGDRRSKAASATCSPAIDRARLRSPVAASRSTERGCVRQLQPRDRRSEAAFASCSLAIDGARLRPPVAASRSTERGCVRQLQPRDRQSEAASASCSLAIDGARLRPPVAASRSTERGCVRQLQPRDLQRALHDRQGERRRPHRLLLPVLLGRVHQRDGLRDAFETDQQSGQCSECESCAQSMEMSTCLGYAEACDPAIGGCN
jgi:hypothetical protein